MKKTVLSSVVNNFGLSAPDWLSNMIGSKSDDRDSIDTFKELTKTIEQMIDALPQIDIPSSVIGKGKIDALKEVFKAYKNTNVTKVALLACSMTNLIAKHSGAKSVSKLAGFMQNCMALYAIGDTVCNRINFKWNVVDQLYVMVSTAEPSFMDISLDDFREISKNHDNEINNTLTITPASNLAFVKIMSGKEPMKWFSAIDQSEHTITPIRTNIVECKRVAPTRTNDSNDDDDRDVQLRYTFDENCEQYKHIDGENEQTKSTVFNAVYKFMFDNTEFYAIQTVRSTESDDGSGTVYVPSNQLKMFWIPKNHKTVMTKAETSMLRRNVELYIEMMFAMSIDPTTYLYTFDEDGDLKEMLRPMAIPPESVSDTIPKIIKAIKIAFDKGLSRSYALVGQPGTGKTIGAQQISNAYPDVCTFKITADVIVDSDQTDAMLRYIKAIKKCIIILDDMDSYSLTDKNDNVISYLNFFDKLNQAAKNDQVSYIFFATINDPKKVNQRIMRRSGRIDEMFEIGMPSANTMRYLFKYNDERVNKEHPTDFSDPKFDDVIQFAIESGITAADITNIFTDIVIYSGTEDIEKSPAELSGDIKDESNQDEAVCTPEKLKSAIERVNKRNKMSGNSYVDGDE
jgi:hypothetical protein